MKYIVLDLEWNNAYSKKLKRYFNEIIEIGAVMLNDELKIIDEFSCIIKPEVTKKLRENTTEITNITNDELKKGIDFVMALENLFDWCGDKENTFLTWGDGDIRVMIDNCKYFECNDILFGIYQYLDLQKFFQQMVKTNSENQIGLSNAAELINIDTQNMSMHRALDDSIVSAKCFMKIFDKKKFDLFVKKFDEDFIKRLDFKIKVITNIKNPLVDKSYLNYKCEICGKSAKQMTQWKYNNQYFRAEYYCKHCNRKVQVAVRYKVRYDSTEVRKIVKPILQQQENK